MVGRVVVVVGGSGVCAWLVLITVAIMPIAVGLSRILIDMLLS